MKRRLFALGLAATLSLSLLSGCGTKPSTPSDTGSSGNDSAGGKVYYLNFKPEQNAQWQELADLYTKETGVEVTVLTAASGSYETTLKSEMAKTDAPTLFQVNGPVGLAAWKDYCYDLTGSDIASQLTSEEFALMDGDKMAGIGYVIETYGIIYNKALLEQAGYSADDIKSFADLKKVAEDITARKDNRTRLPIPSGSSRNLRYYSMQNYQNEDRSKSRSKCISGNYRKLIESIVPRSNCWGTTSSDRQSCTRSSRS